MEHRRRGDDFSQSLRSFCSNTTDRGSAVAMVAEEKCSSTRSNIVTSSSDKSYDGDARISSNRDDTSDSSSFKSTILAGQVAKGNSRTTSESSYQTARSPSSSGEVRSNEGSWDARRRFQTPSELNRVINQQFSPEPELDLSQTATEPRTSHEMNRNVSSSDVKSSEDSRDTNHNIKVAVEQSPYASNENNLRMAFQSPGRKVRIATPRPDSGDRKDAWSVLSSLDNVLDPGGDKTSKTKQKILRRLSQEFLYSPRTFTERLVTIIDESETGYPVEDSTGVNLSRMTKEFRKMCKFIQDESMPEMAPSLCMNSMLGTSKYPDDNKTMDQERPSTIVESPAESQAIDCETPPQIQNPSSKKIYRKTPMNIFKNTHRNNRAPANFSTPNSTREFEYWEKYCEGLPDSPLSSAKNDNRAKPLRRSLSIPDITEESKENLMLKCEKLIGSLDDTNHTDFETFDSHRGPPKDVEVNNSPPNYVEIDENELSNSLMFEKELQRKRCFETALLMQEIEEEAKMTKEEYPKALERRGIDPGTAFLDTISTCMAYRNCLSGMYKIDRPNANVASSVDSGFDSRSFGRTLYACSKKSCDEASSRNSRRNNVNRVSTIDNKKSTNTPSIRSANVVRSATGATKKNLRKPVSTENLCKKNIPKLKKISCSVDPSRNTVFLRPTGSVGKTIARSSSGENLKSPTGRPTTKFRDSENLENRRTNDANGKLIVPKLNFVPPTPKTPVGRSDSRATSGEKKCGSLGKNITRTVSPRRTSPRCNNPRQSIMATSWKNNVLKSTPKRAKSPNFKGSTTPVKSSPRISSKDSHSRVADLHLENRDNTPSKISNSPGCRYFVTPGRNSPVRQKKKIKTYFPSMDDDIKNQRSQLVLRSLHAPGLYRLGCNTVISPVSMYIRGTDVNLIQNNHERKNEMMLTPDKNVASVEKLKFDLASKKSGSRDSPRRKNRLFDDQKELASDDSDVENMREPGFALPSTSYNQPAQVHTVNESPKLIGGSRTRGLLESMQNRLVIRHGAKSHEKHEKNVVPESFDDNLADMSIHVLKSAEKTNFIDRRKF